MGVVGCMQVQYFGVYCVGDVYWFGVGCYYQVGVGKQCGELFECVFVDQVECWGLQLGLDGIGYVLFQCVVFIVQYYLLVVSSGMVGYGCVVIGILVVVYMVGVG